MLNSFDTASMKTVSKITHGGSKAELKKHKVVLNYKFMGSVDHVNQFRSMYCFIWKLLKWWQKVF